MNANRFKCKGDNSWLHGGTFFNNVVTGTFGSRFWPKFTLKSGTTNNLVLRSNTFTDKDVFAAAVFQDDCDEKHESQSFSGVGAHQQNAHSKHAIQTIIYMTRTFMMHVSLHCSGYGINDFAL